MGSPQTILIVEDQPGFRQIYQDVLENAGFAVLTAEDGESGWQLIQKAKPHLVLLDLGLPKLNGYEVLQRARAEDSTKEVPIVIFSVVGEQKEINKAMGLGANDYALKGFTNNRDLIGKIKINLKTTDEHPADPMPPVALPPIAQFLEK